MTGILSAPPAGPVCVQLVPARRFRAGQILRQQGKGGGVQGQFIRNLKKGGRISIDVFRTF